MIIDHIGFFFYPNIILFRILGRVSAPIFFFLIGFSPGRKTNYLLIIYGIALTIFHFITEQTIFQLDVLFTLFIAKYLRKNLTENNISLLFIISFVFEMLFRPYIQYGGIMFLFTLLGYYKKIEDEQLLTKFITIFGTYTLYLIIGFYIHFSMENQPMFFLISLILILALEMFVCGYLLYNFSLKRRIKYQFINFVIKAIARNSLHLYFVHVILFKIITFYV